MNEKRKVLVTLTFAPENISNFDRYVDEFEAQGYEVILEPTYKRVPTDKLIPMLQGIYAHVVGSEIITKQVMEQCPDVKIFSRMGAGYDDVDIPAATEKGVAVTVTPGANAEAVAEHVFSMMAALTRHIVEFDHMTREGVWGSFFGTSMCRKTIGIIGMGAIGKILSHLVSGFDMRVLAYDPYPNADFSHKSGVEYCPLKKLLKESDFISVNCPITTETEHMLSFEEFEQMKDGVQLINCARGRIIDEAALLKGLQSGKVRGAALDCFETEPINLDNPLLKEKHVIVSPHTAGMTHEGRGKVVQMAFQNIVDITAGKIPTGTVNPVVLKNRREAAL